VFPAFGQGALQTLAVLEQQGQSFDVPATGANRVGVGLGPANRHPCPAKPGDERQAKSSSGLYRRRPADVRRGANRPTWDRRLERTAEMA